MLNKKWSSVILDQKQLREKKASLHLGYVNTLPSSDKQSIFSNLWVMLSNGYEIFGGFQWWLHFQCAVFLVTTLAAENVFTSSSDLVSRLGGDSDWNAVPLRNGIILDL